ncbi:biosynthesis protein PigD [Notoacmeibacter marinus]|uniref:biosynthesis protein PigD n=1 Tax=Notoacmeibacter marinus TaxID=1876515 RepID=UPI000DF459C5|nr:biosynthesis protein PigD [Notoacmeibacter marinus]
MDVCVSIIVVTRNADFFQAGASVISDLQDALFDEVTIDSDWDVPLAAMPEPGPHYLKVRDRAMRFIKGGEDRISLHVVQAPSLPNAVDRLASVQRNPDVHHVGMAYVDYSGPYHAERLMAEIDRDLRDFYAALRERRMTAFETPSSTAVFQPQQPLPYQVHPLNFIRCVLPNDPDILRAQLLCLWMDFYELSLVNRRIRAGDRAEPTSALADLIGDFLDERTDRRWALQYYTGSLVSSLISAFETLADERGIPVLRGPSEHSLACGAMANWQLYEMPSVTIITSGMIDEFRGTLANLCEARARGFVICAEQKPAQWYAFQSTITPENDSREMLRARRIPYVYLDDPADLQRGVERALRLYDESLGPVFILATQQVLNVKAAEKTTDEAPSLPMPALPKPDESTLVPLVELINSGPSRLLLQPGRLRPDTMRLLVSIADRAGIALVDSIIHPGAVPTHLDGAPCPNHLGTLSVYGFSDAVYRFLHRDGRIAPRDSQALIFLGDKISQVVTPFTEAKLHRQFQIAQVINEPGLIAPFADIALVADPQEALLALESRLDVPPDLRAKRLAAIAAARDGHEDLSSCLPSLPMTPNYFFGTLGRLLTDMIEREGYDFTGLYDVGRCGVSAIRNLPKTRTGFSGWYGRALMGDAYMATLALARTCPTDLLTFAGDGARALVPDILPSLLENALSSGPRRDRTISIFVLSNSGLSAINSYQERILFNRTSRQMRVLNIATPESDRDMCGYRVVTRTIDLFDREAMHRALRTRGRINLFTVNLAHNNEGDGMSLAHVNGWQQHQQARPKPMRVAREGI